MIRLSISISESVRTGWSSAFPVRRTSDVKNSSSDDRNAGEISTAEVLSRKQKIAAWLILLCLSVFVLSTNLNYPLFEPDEARNAQLGLEIYNSGQWMTLRLGDEFYWDKPPLVAWSTAISYHVFGVSPFSTRLPCNLSAMLTVIAMMLLGSRLVGFRAAWLGSILVLLTGGFVLSARYLTMDATLTACTTTMLMSLYLACRDRQRRWVIVAGIACGIGMLTKGPIIGVLGIPPLVVAMWLQRNSYLIRRETIVWFSLPAIAIATPWFAAMSIAFFPDFLTYFFWKHHVVRFSDAFNHHEPWWYYLAMAPLTMFPASIMFPSLTKFMLTRDGQTRQLRCPEFGFMMLVICWVIGFFSISQSKLPTYILPAFPFVCLMLGTMLDRTVLSRSLAFNTGRWLKTTPRRTGIALALLIVCGQVTGVALFGEKLSVPLWIVIAVGVAVFALAMMSWVSRKTEVAWCSAAIVAILFVTLVSNCVIPAIARHRSIHAAACITCREDAVESPVVFYCHEDYGCGLWDELGESVAFKASDGQQIRRHLQLHPDSILISKATSINRLNRRLAGTMTVEPVEGRRRVFRVKQSPMIASSAQDAPEVIR